MHVDAALAPFSNWRDCNKVSSTGALRFFWNMRPSHLAHSRIFGLVSPCSSRGLLRKIASSSFSFVSQVSFELDQVLQVTARVEENGEVVLVINGVPVCVQATGVSSAEVLL